MERYITHYSVRGAECEVRSAGYQSASALRTKHSALLYRTIVTTDRASSHRAVRSFQT